MRSYAALFVGPDARLISVGPFDQPIDAAEFGTEHGTDVVKFTGMSTVQVMSPMVFERYALGQQLRTQAALAPGAERWVGEITRCDPDARYGFITSAEGRSWFFSRISDHGHDPEALMFGQQVTFTGSPSPQPNQKYPTAYSIRSLAAAAEATQ